MDHEELCRLSRLARSGDIAARNAIVEEYRGFAAKLIRRQRWRNVEDAIQDGLIGLISAAQTWIPGSSTFPHYAALCVIRSVRDADEVFKQPVVMLDIPKSQPAPSVDDDEVNPTMSRLLAAIDSLAPRARTALCLRHGIGCSAPLMLKEIGELMGTTATVAHDSVKRAERRLVELML